jgi:hypothetical protein
MSETRKSPITLITINRPRSPHTFS